MRVIDQAPRSPKTVREEIVDLQAYLVGLPAEWRESGAFLAYEERLRSLDRELALGRIAELASHLSDTSTHGTSLEPSEVTNAQVRLLAILKKSEREYMELAAFRAKESKLLVYATLLASSVTVASALASVSVLIIPGALIAVGTAAAMALFRFSDQAHKAAKRAEYIKIIQNEIEHLPDVSESSAFETSARVEALITNLLHN